MTLLLASGSPRRRELLTATGVPIEVHPFPVDESRLAHLAPVEQAVALAVLKAEPAPRDRVVLAADTLVHTDDRVYGKPRNRDDGASILGALSDRWHRVTTGVCVSQGDRCETFSVTTRVRFRALADREIRKYLSTGEADDKAGAYGIQGRALAFVARIEGSLTNVMGLPVEETLTRLRAFGVAPTT